MGVTIVTPKVARSSFVRLCGLGVSQSSIKITTSSESRGEVASSQSVELPGDPFLAGRWRDNTVKLPRMRYRSKPRKTRSTTLPQAHRRGFLRGVLFREGAHHRRLVHLATARPQVRGERDLFLHYLDPCAWRAENMLCAGPAVWKDLREDGED